MGIMALIFGLVGGICAVMGIITAAEVLAPIMPEFTWMFWLVLSAVMMLISIAFGLGRGGDYE